MFAQHPCRHGHDLRRIGQRARRLGQIVEKAKVFFALAEGLIRPLALGDVDQEAHAFVRAVLENCRAQQDRHARAVLADVFLFKRRADSRGREFLQRARSR
jgi:hypothetical protein